MATCGTADSLSSSSVGRRWLTITPSFNNAALGQSNEFWRCPFLNINNMLGRLKYYCAKLCSGDSTYKSLSEQETSRSGVLTPAGGTPRQMKAQAPHPLTQPSSGGGGRGGGWGAEVTLSLICPAAKCCHFKSRRERSASSSEGPRGGRMCKAFQTPEIFVPGSRRKKRPTYGRRQRPSRSQRGTDNTNDPEINLAAYGAAEKVR